MKEERVSRTDDEKELDRRNFLKCMAWVGTGASWTLSGGILKGSPLGQSAGAAANFRDQGALRFVQISDSHIGFDKPANTDVVNVVNLKAGGLGILGAEQLEWLDKDVKPLKSSTPIVVFAHIPLWSVYPEWGGARTTANAPCRI